MKYFNSANEKNSAYSQRALAQKVGITSGALSGILSGKRRVSSKLCQKILEPLNINDSVKKNVIELFNSTENRVAPAIKREDISADAFSKICTPDHYNVLNTLKLDHSKRTLFSLKKSLSLPEKTLLDIIDDLVDVRRLTNQNGYLTVHSGPIKVGDQLSSETIQRFHKLSLDEAKERLEQLPVEERNFRSITIPANVENIDEINKAIEKFTDEVAHLLSSGPKTDVFKMNIQLYPVTHSEAD